jgi:hypothetical protein
MRATDLQALRVFGLGAQVIHRTEIVMNLENIYGEVN